MSGGERSPLSEVAAGDRQSNQDLEERKSMVPVLGAAWQSGRRGKCLPCTTKKPRYMIPANKLEKYRSYMRDHAIICKFVGVWPAERDLTKWIQQKWQPQGHIELKLGAKGFFTVIFFNLKDKEQVFDNGPYFYNNADLFLRFWEDCYNLDKETFMAARVWVLFIWAPN